MNMTFILTLFLFAINLSSCKTRSSGSDAKSNAGEDSVVREYRDNFCSGENIDPAVLLSKRWDCNQREAFHGNWQQADYAVRFRQSPTSSVLLTAEWNGNGGTDTMSFKVQPSGQVVAEHHRRFGDLNVGSAFRLSVMPNGTMYIAEFVNMSDLPPGIQLTGSCPGWDTERAISSVAMCEAETCPDCIDGQ
jgi:hypothetical protein